ncbi:GAF domain-containing protein [Streptomonospora litoralis]|uniref:Acetoin dehydrogenase operon transcriptional activator AcoR n=1 Tax=Streptomonospora litoralis TaxID=2498135 RepID=A0A4P6Q0Y2_9ACTN|nr:GAF domain-containing protein [Streptomonospora litoralis]QBI54208.1 Acetoin dehydrogenase operon transcriptional activator AcoR [Streptomonospora litoralis]
MAQPYLDTAVPAGVEPGEHARLLHRVHEAVLSGRRPPARLRPVIADSWERMRRRRVDPERGNPSAVLRHEELQRHRSASPLAELLPMLREALMAVADDASHFMVVADEESRVLWRDGPVRMRRLADGMGAVEGSQWSEEAAGTNALGTALAVDRPMQVYSAEHYVRGLHQVTCACAPVHDPRSGRVLGAVGVSGPARTVHPATLALVSAVARHGESQLRGRHHAHLERLRAVAAPMLAGMQENAVVTDTDGWTATAARMDPPRRVLLPRGLEGGAAWLPGLGECGIEPLPGGWLIRPGGGEAAPPTEVVLDLSDGAAPQVTVGGLSGRWTHRLTLRHTELLVLLSRSAEGCSAARLAADLFGDSERLVTVRAEMSRLRRHLGGVVESRPYRFNEGLRISVRMPECAADLLPASTAPGIRRLRAAAERAAAGDRPPR